MDLEKSLLDIGWSMYLIFWAFQYIYIVEPSLYSTYLKHQGH